MSTPSLSVDGDAARNLLRFVATGGGAALHLPLPVEDAVADMWHSLAVLGSTQYDDAAIVTRDACMQQLPHMVQTFENLVCTCCQYLPIQKCAHSWRLQLR